MNHKLRETEGSFASTVAKVIMSKNHTRDKCVPKGIEGWFAEWFNNAGLEGEFVFEYQDIEPHHRGNVGQLRVSRVHRQTEQGKVVIKALKPGEAGTRVYRVSCCSAGGPGPEEIIAKLNALDAERRGVTVQSDDEDECEALVDGITEALPAADEHGEDLDPSLLAEVTLPPVESDIDIAQQLHSQTIVVSNILHILRRLLRNDGTVTDKQVKAAVRRTFWQYAKKPPMEDHLVEEFFGIVTAQYLKRVTSSKGRYYCFTQQGLLLAVEYAEHCENPSEAKECLQAIETALDHGFYTSLAKEAAEVDATIAKRKAEVERLEAEAKDIEGKIAELQGQLRTVQSSARDHIDRVDAETPKQKLLKEVLSDIDREALLRAVSETRRRLNIPRR